MAVVTPPAFSEGSSAAGTSRPAAVARLFATMAGEGIVAKIGWTILSIGLFVNLFTSIFVSKTLFEVGLQRRPAQAALSI